MTSNLNQFVLNTIQNILNNHNFILPDNDDLQASVLLEIVTQFENSKSEKNKNRKKDQIKTIGYNKIKNLENLPDKICSICIDNFCIGEYKRTLKCNHTFHKKCIDRWFKKDHFDCPLCRENIIN